MAVHNGAPPDVIVVVDGRYVEESAAAVPISNRGFLFAEAVFETARLHDGGYFRLERHLERLEHSAATLRIPLPSRGAIADIAFQLAARNALQNGSFRITVTRGTNTDAFVVATLAPMAEDWLARAARGWRLVTARVRTPPAATVPAALKATGRTYAHLARQDAADAGVDDALLLTTDGFVAEGPAWNVFWRHGDTLFTPALHVGVLEGVTRSEIIELASHAGLRICETSSQRNELDDADEMFATMTSLGVVPIRALDGRDLPETRTAERLQAEYWARVAAAVERPVGTDRA